MNARITGADAETLAMLRDAAREFTRREVQPGALRGLRAADPPFEPSTWQAMAAMGWTGLLIDEALGGSGIGLEAMCAVLAETGRGLAPEPLVACAVLATLAIHAADESPLRTQLLRGIAPGHELPALAFEASTPRGTRPQALRMGRGWLLNGEVRFVRPGRGATGFVVAADTPDGMAMFWLRQGLPGVTVQHELLTDGADAAWLRFDAVHLQDEHLLAQPGRGEPLLQRAQQAACIAVAAELLGVMRAALDIGLEHLRTRRQFGVPIGSFQALQHRAVDLHLQQSLTAAVVEDAARAFDAHLAGNAAVAQLACHAKARAAEAALLTAKEVMQFHGAMGYTDECDVGLYLKRSLSLSAWLGNATEHRRRYVALRFTALAPQPFDARA